MNILDNSFTELEEIFTASGFEKYRAHQVYNWMMKGVSIIEMSNIPLSVKDFVINSFDKELETVTVVGSVKDSAKFLFRLADGNMVETVFMNNNYGNTVCVSTQIGCRMGCVFCASCKHGFIRNLTAGEITAQYLSVNKYLGSGRNISNIVLMGMGEPFDNYANTVKFLRNINYAKGTGISYRNISLSTCGIVPAIEKFITEEMPVNLCISLHASNDVKRNQILPISKKYTINEILSVCKNYFNKTGRRISFEYILISGFNDSASDINELSALLAGINCHVNVIPYNEISECDFRAPSKKQVYCFVKKLEATGITVTVRHSKGNSLAGACGQLRNQNLEK